MRLKRSGSGMAVLALASVFVARPADGQTFMALGEVAYVDYAGMAPGGAYHAPGDDETFLQVSIGERRLRVLRGSEVLHEFPVAVGKGAYLRHRDAEHRVGRRHRGGLLAADLRTSPLQHLIDLLPRPRLFLLPEPACRIPSASSRSPP